MQHPTLRPSIARQYTFAGRTVNGFSQEQEKTLLYRFRSAAYRSLNREPSLWEALFLGRHHGLPVRLLDWTANPLIAAYCACAREAEADGVIYFARSSRQESEYIDIFDRQDPLGVDGVRFIYPFSASPRMSSQAALYTIHAPPWDDLFQLAGRDDCDVQEIEAHTVPKQEKPAILVELQRLGVSAATMDMDLDGLAMSLWNALVMRTGEG